VFYLPLAFFVPPSIFLIHSQFNLIFQFWIHTEIIDHLGPLEFILNTPRHHRIHHGSNRYCLDKNYAGVLIIWDRMFGTFVEEKPGEKIVYGLVEDVNSMNPFWLQLFYFPKSFARMTELPSWWDKLCVLIKGPGWSPGKPRLGDPLDCPEVPDREIYNPQIPKWQTIYAVVHFLIALAIQDYLLRNVLEFTQFTVILVVAYIIVTLTSVGFVLENRLLGTFTELTRCSLTLVLLHSTKLGYQTLLSKFVMLLFTISTTVWLAHYFVGTVKDSSKSKKIE
jgi:alkylglycerol monooxygenase